MATHSVISKSESPIRGVNDFVPNPVQIEVDTHAFEMDEMLKIRGIDNQLLGYFQRVENPNFETKGAAVYNLNKEKTFVIMPDVAASGIKLYIKNNSDEQGLIDINSSADVSLNSVSVKYKNDVSFFDKPITLEINYFSEVNASFSGASANSIEEYIFFYNDDVIMGKEIQSSLGSQTKRIMSNRKYLLQNPDLVSCLTVALEILDDVNKKLAEQNSETGLNHNGTIDHNNNPADRF